MFFTRLFNVLQVTLTPLLMEENLSLLPQVQRVAIVGTEAESLEELQALLKTLNLESPSRFCVPLRKISPTTYIGSGKLEEIAGALKATEPITQAVVFDTELSPSQLRHLEKFFQLPVLDRPSVIIQIFSENARTQEAKLQVGLARLQYLLPRLSHYWNHFERQRGGGTGSRGMGEKQLEVDRRLVKDRVALLKERLKHIQKERALRREARKEVLKVALVGYTNVGKSTLLNALTESQVLAENKLFATLDASLRTLDPHSHPPVVMIDTVGFIKNLPPALVASFRSTLEEVCEADLLVHVVDASHPQAFQQFRVTEQVLKELGVGDVSRLVVLNKIDRLSSLSEQNQVRLLFPQSLAVSAHRLEDVKRLRDAIVHHFHKQLPLWKLFLPYAESRLEAQLHQHGAVELKKHLEKGTLYHVRMEASWVGRLELKKYFL